MKYPAPSLPPPRMIHGIASSEQIVDHAAGGDGSNNCVMLARGFPLVVPVPLLVNHSGSPVGQVIHLRRLGTQIYMRAVVFSNEVWREITDIKLRGLSCGFHLGRPREIKLKNEGVVKYFDQYALKEISIVEKAANTECFFRIFSGGHEMEIAGERPLSEHRRTMARAKATIARIDANFPKRSLDEFLLRREQLLAGKVPIEKMSSAERQYVANVKKGWRR
jgi:hypothetical protein